MDIVKRLREQAASWLSFGWDNDDIFDDAANEIERLREQAHYHYENGLKKDVEIERLREVNITQAKWLYDEQQAHKALRDKVRQWLGDDKPDILKESE